MEQLPEVVFHGIYGAQCPNPNCGLKKVKLDVQVFSLWLE